MIKLFLFDVDRVLTRVSFAEVYEKFSQKTKLNRDEFSEYYLSQRPELLVGKKSIRDIYMHVSKQVPGVTEDAFGESFVQTIFECTTVNTELLDWIDVTHQAVSCAILTNNSESRGEVDRRLGLHEHFDFVLESYLEGLKKPESEFFKRALHTAHCEPEEVVFVDDQEKNTSVAREMGMKTILFQDNDQFFREVPKLMDL